MAKKPSGEVSVKLGTKTHRLRLEMGTILDLEDYLDTGLLKLVQMEMGHLRLKTTGMLFVAMTGGDFTDEAHVREQMHQISPRDFSVLTQKVYECLIVSFGGEFTPKAMTSTSSESTRTSSKKLKSHDG